VDLSNQLEKHLSIQGIQNLANWSEKEIGTVIVMTKCAFEILISEAKNSLI